MSGENVYSSECYTPYIITDIFAISITIRQERIMAKLIKAVKYMLVTVVVAMFSGLLGVGSSTTPAVAGGPYYLDPVMDGRCPSGVAIRCQVPGNDCTTLGYSCFITC